MGKLVVIVGGQFGSEAKGAVAGFLAAETHKSLICTRVAGPNAGHSVVDKFEHTWRLRHLPCGLVTNPRALGLLAAGSEIDWGVLEQEISQIDPNWERVKVDAEATIIEDLDLKRELDLVGAIGSTGKGIGAARARRIMREAATYGGGVDTTTIMRKHLAAGGEVHIEGTQGFGLGLHAGYYPQCTSSDCRAIDFLAMAGLSPWAPYVTEFEVWVVLRTFPIRVAGNSGPLLAETSWQDLRLEPEQTTVTQKIRRVGYWDSELAKAAIAANGGPGGGHVRVALTMVDYMKDSDDFIQAVENDLRMPISLIGAGPRLTDYRRR